MEQHKDNTNEVKRAFHSVLYSCVFSLVEACSGDTVLIELTHHPLYYINVVLFDYDMMCTAYVMYANTLVLYMFTF